MVLMLEGHASSRCKPQSIHHNSLVLLLFSHPHAYTFRCSHPNHHLPTFFYLPVSWLVTRTKGMNNNIDISALLTTHLYATRSGSGPVCVPSQGQFDEYTGISGSQNVQNFGVSPMHPRNNDENQQQLIGHFGCHVCFQNN